MEILDSRWFQTAALAIVLPIAFALLRRFFPRHLSRDEPPVEMTEWQYQVGQWTGFLIFCACGGMIGYALYDAMLDYRAAQTADPPEGAFVILPDIWSWFLGLFFLALGGGVFLTSIVTRVFWPQWSQQLLAESERRAGMRIGTAIVPLYAIIIGLGLAFTILLGDAYVRIEPTRVVFNPFLSFDEIARPVSDIRAVRFEETFTNTQGEVKPKPHYLIEFADGSSWSTHEAPYGIEDPAEYAAAFQALQRALPASPAPNP